MSELFYHLDISQKPQMVITLPKISNRKEALLQAKSLLEKNALDLLWKKSPIHVEEGVRFPIPSEIAFELLKMLSSTGRLLHKGQKVIIDPFTKAEGFIQAKALNKTQVEICAKFKLGRQEEPLTSCTAIFWGSPTWILYIGVIRLLDTEGSLKWLKIPEAILQGKELQEFLEEIEGITWLEEVSSDPLPFICLTDQHGGFANLWFDYGIRGKIASFEEKEFFWRKKTLEKQWEQDLLETDFRKKKVGDSSYYCPLDKVAKSITFLIEIGWKVLDHQNKQVVCLSQETLLLEERPQAFLVRAEFDYQGYRANLQQVIGAFNRRSCFVELAANTVGLIDLKKIEEKWADFSELEFDQEGVHLPFRQLGLLSEQKSPLEIFKQLKHALQPVVLGEKFKGQLFTYQNQGLSWLSFLERNQVGGLLADEMGLGKTIQVIAFLSQLELKQPCLIVVPTSLLFNWQNEFTRFFPSCSIHVHIGKERMKSLPPIPSVILTSYAILRIDQALFTSLDFQLIILDEAQVIKNPDSQIAEVCFQLRAKMRVAITGTPIENRLEDLFSLFYFLNKGLLGERKQFQAEALASQVDSRYLKRIQKLTRPFILRRTKKQVALDLPEKLEQTIWVEMSEEQRDIYEKYLQSTRIKLRSKETNQQMQILEAILRLRQICAHPLLVDPAAQDLYQFSGKFSRVMADLEEVVEEKRKVLFYSQFTSMLHLMKKEAQNRNWKYVYLDGSTKNREQIVAQFQEDEQTLLFFISLKAGGVGLNLTKADYVFLYDPWWNTAIENQAIDRAHRLGRSNQVIARRYVTALSIEEKIMRLKKHKQQLSRTLMEDLSNIEALSLEDLIHLLD
ncbi:MAG TPA: DEAD/DEAH box helicase [Candidatus Rhabdochlamydia sp.]|nr:DEAD/DEAH box helicase [Candidatus Rhabdochlamydia sp.]